VVVAVDALSCYPRWYRPSGIAVSAAFNINHSPAETPPENVGDDGAQVPPQPAAEQNTVGNAGDNAGITTPALPDANPTADASEPTQDAPVAAPPADDTPAQAGGDPAPLAPECSQAGGAALSDEWQKLVALVCRRKPALGSVLQHACPQEVSAQKVKLALDPGSFYFDQLKNPRNREELARCCAEFFGSQPRIEVETLSRSSGLTLAQAQELEAKQKKQDLERRAVEHPAVQEAIRIFGAKVDAVEAGSKESGSGSRGG
jgi:DNA polymerase-3 subunit gamma/tau